MSTATVQPKDMNWIRKGVFGIEWSDDHKGVYPIRYLRLHCPCAACTDEWTGQLKLKDEDVPLLIMLKDIESVGHYALKFTWSDGHDTGLYTFGNLRKMCQCEICAPNKDSKSKNKLIGRRLM